MNRTTMMALAIVLTAAGGPAAAQAVGQGKRTERIVSQPAGGAPLSREQVLAELQIWRESGLAALPRGQVAGDVTSDSYYRAAARYAALSDSPEFEARVGRIAGERGR